MKRRKNQTEENNLQEQAVVTERLLVFMYMSILKKVQKRIFVSNIATCTNTTLNPNDLLCKIEFYQVYLSKLLTSKLVSDII